MELNNLRQELKDAHKHIRDMESILGISRKYMHPKEAQARLQMAVQSHEDIHNKYRSKLEVRVCSEVSNGKAWSNSGKFLEFLPNPTTDKETNIQHSSELTHMINYFACPVQQICIVLFLFAQFLLTYTM
jgi:hypothetical protein